MIILIDNMQVHRDHHGRLRFNDIHKQAGEEKRHQVDNYLRSDKAAARAMSSFPAHKSLPPELYSRPDAKN